MGYVYHGSKTTGLKKLEPRVSPEQKKCVFAIKSKAVAAVLIGKAESIYYTLGGLGTPELPFYLIERLPGMFERIFNKSGSIYYLDDKNFKSAYLNWDAELISEQEEEVIYEERIENVLDKLNEYAESGEILIYHYPNRPKNIPLDNSDLIPLIIKWHHQGIEKLVKEFLELYPDLALRFYEELNKGKDKSNMTKK